MESNNIPPLHAEEDIFKDPSLHLRLWTDYRDEYYGIFVIYDFPAPGSSGPISALPRASAKRALEFGAHHLRRPPSHDVSIGLVFVGRQFSVARIDRAGAAFSPMRRLKEKEGLEVLVRVVRSLKQGPQPDPNNPPRDPIAMLPTYLTHEAGKSFAQPYLNSTMLAQQWGKPFMMFETNTASCGGFPGVSDSCGSALWAIDYGLQMAYSNFTGALLHVGGQDVSYNVSFFLPPMLLLSVSLI